MSEHGSEELMQVIQLLRQPKQRGLRLEQIVVQV